MTSPNSLFTPAKGNARWLLVRWRAAMPRTEGRRGRARPSRNVHPFRAGSLCPKKRWGKIMRRHIGLHQAAIRFRAAAMESGASLARPKPGQPFARSALQQRRGFVGQCGLGIPRKAEMPQRRDSRAETVQPRPEPRAPASLPPRSYPGSRHPD
jgi:hypothetical protein